MTGKNNDKIRYVAVGGAVAVVLLSVGAGMAFFFRTLVIWWIPVAVAAAIAVASAPALSARWGWLTGHGGRLFNFLCHVVITSSVLYGAILATNYVFADESTVHEEIAVVRSKYSKKHTRYRRGARGRQLPAGEYSTWHILVEFDNGKDKEISMPLDKYNKIKVGSRRRFTMAMGLFGMPVIR